MRIKPRECTAQLGWLDKAGNTHCVLQAHRKESVITTLFTRAVQDDHRILLRMHASKMVYIIALDSSFGGIHQDWNWIESNLLRKVRFGDADGCDCRRGESWDTYFGPSRRLAPQDGL